MIEDAKVCWLESALEDGVTVPEPGPPRNIPVNLMFDYLKHFIES